MVVPILFFASLVIGGYFNVTSYLDYRTASINRDNWKQDQARLVAEKEKSEAEKAVALKKKMKAEKLAQWVEGTRALQPISVSVARCLHPEVTVGELSLERSLEIPSQIIMTVRLNNGNIDEIGRIQQSIVSQNYRAYNSQQSKAGEVLEYRTMLIWQQL
jgi:hypothetical protein